MTTLKTTTTHILVVDDVPDNLRLITKILESQGYVVRKALSGNLSLQAIQRDPPDLILLDINMPDRNGYEVCQQLKVSDLTRHIPVIVMSALDQVSDQVQAFGLGGQDYITKPFQELEVLTRIKNQVIIQQQQKQLLEQNLQLQHEIQKRQQAEAKVRRLNFDLERQVQARTLELQQSLRFETTLKRISDKVQDSLDPHQVLQNAVEELAIALEVQGCDAGLYSPDRRASPMRYPYAASGAEVNQGERLPMADASEMYHHIQTQRTCFAFCPIQPPHLCNHSATLACPIFDEQVDPIDILGDLWLFKDSASGFSETELHLVQQVANRCAIALRQAKLYEAAQAQVRELERLNHLKDDFLSTISHELRTPIASMKMVIKLLTTVTEQGHNLVEELSKSSQDNKVVQYFKVLQDECDRELALVEDLLSLQHVEAGTYAAQPTLVNLPDLIPHLAEPFESRTHNQQQTLEINLAPGLPSLNLDIRGISRIITELLSNACKYTPVGETISISASMTQDTTATNPVHYLKLTVVNTGVEIAPEELPRIFDKFYRIPNNDPWKHGGTGLGLALVKKLVEQMDGTIEVESANHQICFEVQLKVDV